MKSRRSPVKDGRLGPKLELRQYSASEQRGVAAAAVSPLQGAPHLAQMFLSCRIRPRPVALLEHDPGSAEALACSKARMRRCSSSPMLASTRRRALPANLRPAPASCGDPDLRSSAADRKCVPGFTRVKQAPRGRSQPVCRARPSELPARVSAPTSRGGPRCRGARGARCRDAGGHA